MDYTVSTTVYCSLEVVGFHRWDDAPEEVKYLSVNHRHKFGIRVDIAVVEHDREVEFHTLRRQIESWIWMMRPSKPDPIVDGTPEINFGSMSCEMIASDLLATLRQTYPGRALYRVEVNEDGENGAIVEAAIDDLSRRLDFHLEHSHDGAVADV